MFELEIRDTGKQSTGVRGDRFHSENEQKSPVCRNIDRLRSRRRRRRLRPVDCCRGRAVGRPRRPRPALDFGPSVGGRGARTFPAADGPEETFAETNARALHARTVVMNRRRSRSIRHLRRPKRKLSRRPTLASVSPPRFPTAAISSFPDVNDDNADNTSGGAV